MAAIGSIRKHSALLVIVIGGALVAFILGDFMKKNHRRDVNAGKVNGVEISIIDFNKKLDENLENTKQQTKKNSLSTNETFRVRQQTWDQMVRKILMDKQFEDLGIDVTADEMFDLIQGPNPHPLIRQYFVNPNTGVYDRNMVIQYLQNYDRLPDAAKRQWKMLENYIKNDRMRTKYNALIANGYYVPKNLAQLKYQEYNTRCESPMDCRPNP
ncbi:MAG: SurA N-terminal domain-containing protein [Bacteroidales bacterium]|nr:SurA N-terminal domain-containing protein [Bacteroidales bacterium]